jgi:CMP-2-keto-3-deoxyoctulosonic acid synthetase
MKQDAVPQNHPYPQNSGSAIALIPARYAATRFPGKLMQKLGDKSVILHTHDNTYATGLFDEVIVVTDSEIIYKEITGSGGKAVMSKKQHESGSDRIAEAVADLMLISLLTCREMNHLCKKNH